MMPNSVRATLKRALADYKGSGGRAAIVWLNLEPMEGLTAREMDVVRLVAQGCSNKEVAATLIITASSVRSHLDSIFGKLELHNRTQLAYWFYQRSVFVTDDEDEDLQPEDGFPGTYE